MIRHNIDKVNIIDLYKDNILDIESEDIYFIQIKSNDLLKLMDENSTLIKLKIGQTIIVDKYTNNLIGILTDRVINNYFGSGRSAYQIIFIDDIAKPVLTVTDISKNGFTIKYSDLTIVDELGKK